MEVLSFFVGGVLPYIAIVVFIAGMTYRFWIWIKTPQPAKMTLFPAADSTFRGVLAEVLFFPSLFRGDRLLWGFAWFFHATLALVFLGHLRVFTPVLDHILIAAGMTAGGLDRMSGTIGGAAGILLLATGILLVVRRTMVPRVRSISRASDFLAPLLLIAVISSGDVMRFGGHFDLGATRTWAASLAAFNPVVPSDMRFTVHALLAMVLVMYIPFSKILHFGGIFFTQALIKRS